MIGSLRSRCRICHPLVGARGLASDNGHQGSTKGKVEVGRSFLSLDGM